MNILKFSILLSLVLSLNAEAKVELKNNWVLFKSDLEYTVHFPLKTIHGHNTQAKGKAQCDDQQCEFLVAAAVKQFDSGDSNRDQHMLETTKAMIHPLVSVSGKLPTLNNNSTILVELDVEFAGVKKHYTKVPFKIEQSAHELTATGSLVMSLKDYSIKAPSLLGVSIDDQVPLKISTQWKPATGT